MILSTNLYLVASQNMSYKCNIQFCPNKMLIIQSHPNRVLVLENINVSGSTYRKSYNDIKMRNANWLINTCIYTYMYVYKFPAYITSLETFCLAVKSPYLILSDFLSNNKINKRTFMLRQSVRMIHFIKVIIPVNISG